MAFASYGRSFRLAVSTSTNSATTVHSIRSEYASTEFRCASSPSCRPHTPTHFPLFTCTREQPSEANRVTGRARLRRMSQILNHGKRRRTRKWGSDSMPMRGMPDAGPFLRLIEKRAAGTWMRLTLRPEVEPTAFQRPVNSSVGFRVFRGSRIVSPWRNRLPDRPRRTPLPVRVARVWPCPSSGNVSVTAARGITPSSRETGPSRERYRTIDHHAPRRAGSVAAPVCADLHKNPNRSAKEEYVADGFQCQLLASSRVPLLGDKPRRESYADRSLCRILRPSSQTADRIRSRGLLTTRPPQLSTWV